MKQKKLDSLGQSIFNLKYAHPNESGFVDRCRSIARHISSVEKDDEQAKWYDKFYDSLVTGDLVPGGRIIFGSGRNKQNLLNCYVIIPDDNVESIGKLLQDVYKISCGGGGIGFNFSKIRPKGDDIGNIKNSAPGSVSVMKLVNSIGDHVKAGKSRRCLAKGTRVLTEYGSFKSIEDVTTNDKVMTLKGWKKVVESVKQGKQKIVRVWHQDGYLDCTENHRIAVLKDVDGNYDWVEARNLKEGDRLIYVRNSSKSINSSLPTWFYEKPKHSTTCQDITIPELDEGIAWLLGTVAGDGCVVPGARVSVACHSDDVEQIEQVKNQLARFGANVAVYKKEGENCVNVTVASKQLADYFFKNFKQANTPIRVPQCIKDSTEKIKLAYVAGVLDTDGCTLNRPISIMASVYIDFVKDIQSLLYSCGIESRLRYGVNYESRLGWQLLHHLNLITLYSKNRFKLMTENIRIKEIREYQRPQSSNGFPSEFLKDHKIVTGTWSRQNSQMPIDTYERLFGNLSVPIVPVEFLRIENLNIEEETFDLSVEDEHCFIADGVLVHNTALMSMLNVDHPDLIEFLHIKLDRKELNNFNISVVITDEFINACEKDLDWHFSFGNREYFIYEIDKTDKEGKVETLNVVALNEDDAMGRLKQQFYFHPADTFSTPKRVRVKALDLWNRIWDNAVESGEPGIFNWSLTNSYTTVSYFLSMDATNPCGEIPLESYANCCLGHINLANMISEDGTDVDWKRLAKTIRSGIRFLDNVLTANHYPIPETKIAGERSRRIGLGTLGLHHMLIKLGIKYGSDKCLEFLDRLYGTIKEEAYLTSMYIAREKGSFPEFDAEKYLAEEFTKTLTARTRMLIRQNGIRNAVMLTAAPTGTVSMVMGTSTGIEPIFAPMYKRRWKEGNSFKEAIVLDPMFKNALENGQDASHIVGAYDVTPEEHLAIQACVQRHIDNSISKTINLPKDANKDSGSIAKMALKYAPYLKGTTIYRAGSRGEEPLQAIPLTPENIQMAKDLIAQEKASISVEGESCRIGGECGA